MNESEFQRACDEFVSREVYCGVSTMTEYILKKAWEDRDAPFSNEDIENIMQSGEVRWKEEWLEFSSIEELDEWKEEIENEADIKKEHAINEIEESLSLKQINGDQCDELMENVETYYDKTISDMEDAYNEAESQLEEHKEILEYWIVSPYLLSKLQERNEAVIESEQIWCRCTSGQAIAIDGVIREIVKEQLIARSEWDEEAKQILL